MHGMKTACSVIAAVSLLALRGESAAHEDGLLYEADRAVKGEVSVVGVSHAFPDGRIDWLFDPTAKKGPFNPEWTWQLNRMYFWSALAEAYSATGDEKYARAFVRQFSDWFAQTGGVPPERNFNRVGSPWRTIEEGHRLAYSWNAAWRAFSKSPSFCGKAREDFAKSAHAQARHLLAHSTKYNWLLIEMSGAYVFALDFPEFPDAEEIRREALSRFYAAASKQLCPDGQHNEVSLDYHSVFYYTAAKICLRAMEAGRGGELPEGFLGLLERGAEGPLAQITPNFSFPCFNDSSSFCASNIFGTAAKMFPSRADFLWAATEGRDGAPPAGKTASRFLPYSGIVVMRSGWDRDATYLAFDVGPTGANHVHQDKLSFTFWKGGEELVFDDGGGQYERSALRGYATSGYDHSTLLVDDLAQNRSSPRVSERPIDAGWRSDEKEDFAFGVYDQGFGPKELRLARHRREIRFDKAADEFSVADFVESADGKEHSYTLLFQIDSTNVALSADGRTLSADFGRGRKWVLAMALPEGATPEIVSGRLKPTPAGWFFGRNGVAPDVRPATTLFVKFPPMKSLNAHTRLRAMPAGAAMGLTSGSPAKRLSSNTCLASSGETELAAKLPAIFEQSAAHYRVIDAAATPLMNSGDAKEAVPHGYKPHGERRVPHGWNAKSGKLDMRSIYWWTSGHFPGSLWYLYEATGDEFFKDRATVWTEFIAPNSRVSDNHDVGFIMYCSFGNARRILNTDKYDGVLLETAKSLSRRYHDELGLIRSWGKIGDRGEFLVIPDNMMNLELLEAASKMPGGEKRFDEIARSHSTKTMAHHFRADGGTYHVLNYDQRPGFVGLVQEIRRGQGLSCETAWSRGQSWAIYGYTMMYRETGDKAYLDFAQKVSDFAIDNPNMPEDGVPYWDFGAPGEERDSSAASVMASGLLELSTFVGGEKSAKYRAFAVKQLLSLCSDAYFAKPGENGDWLLKHGVGHKPAGTEIDVPLDYGDYYFLEALLRFRALVRSIQE